MSQFPYILEACIILAGLVILVLDLFTTSEKKAQDAGWGAFLVVTFVFLATFVERGGVSIFLSTPELTSSSMYVFDSFAMFFKRFFLVAAMLVILMTLGYVKQFRNGGSEYFALQLFALAGMMAAASANDFSLLFVSLELVTVTFYVLVSFQRSKTMSLEAGVKYLIVGALSSAVLVYGIALVYGTAGHLNFSQIALSTRDLGGNPAFVAGVFLVILGLTFKIAAFPFQMWAPDVYQGAPTPTTAFLAVGSKAVGFVLLLRVLFAAVPSLVDRLTNPLLVVAAITIIYGNLCAIPQRNVKRLLGYSSIAHAGYLLLGVAAATLSGKSAVLFYLCGYLVTALAAFTVLSIVMQNLDGEDVSHLAGLGRRSPGLAAVMTLSMVSLAGVPPLAGFFGKVLLLKAALEQGATNHGFYCVSGVAIVGVVISIYYYFGVIRMMYWSGKAASEEPIKLGWSNRAVLGVCALGIILLGILPNSFVDASQEAVAILVR